MAELVRVAVDAMGGDNAPFVTVKGAVDAVKESQNLKVFLVGKKDIVEKELSAYEYDKDKIEVVDATEVIEMAEPPVMAIRKKKDSSIVKGMNMVKYISYLIMKDYKESGFGTYNNQFGQY